MASKYEICAPVLLVTLLRNDILYNLCRGGITMGPNFSNGHFASLVVKQKRVTSVYVVAAENGCTLAQEKIEI